MKALILAAGRGERLSTVSPEKPKSLIEVHGRAIIEIIIGTACAAGIHDFVIVTGFQKDAIPQRLGDGKRLGARIEYVHNDRWHDLANGYSLHVARDRVGDEFLVMMSDHVFDAGLLRPLLAFPLPESGCVLLTDSRIERCFDLDDATKVRTDGQGVILDMGKHLQSYDCLDTGLFRASRALLAAVAGCLAQGRSSLTDANLALVGQRRMSACMSRREDGDWFDLDTPQALEDYSRRTR